MKRKHAPLCLLLFMAAILCGACAKSNENTEPLVSCALPVIAEDGISIMLEQPEQHVEYGAGKYLVGQDMPGGIFFATIHEDKELAQIAISENRRQIIRESFTSNLIVQLQEGQTLSVEGCKLVNIAFTQDYFNDMELDAVPEGMYLIGYHIEKGGYRVTAMENASQPVVATYKDALLQEPLEIKQIDGKGYFTANTGVYVKLQDVTMKKLVFVDIPT